MSHPLPLLLSATLLGACAINTDPEPNGPDLQLASEDLDQVLRATDPDPLLVWALAPHSIIDTRSGCPSVSTQVQDGGVLELWAGDCTQPDGTQITGRLSWFDGDNSAWAAGEHFAVWDSEGLQASLDGAIEVQATDELWLADVSAAACYLDCTPGPASVDLSYTVFPASGYPADYDLTVSGVVIGADDDSAILIDGAWRTQSAVCEAEPVSGMLAVKRGVHQTLVLDGALECDACASWTVQGRLAPAFCSSLR